MDSFSAQDQEICFDSQNYYNFLTNTQGRELEPQIEEWSTFNIQKERIFSINPNIEKKTHYIKRSIKLLRRKKPLVLRVNSKENIKKIESSVSNAPRDKARLRKITRNITLEFNRTPSIDNYRCDRLFPPRRGSTKKQVLLPRACVKPPASRVLSLSKTYHPNRTNTDWFLQSSADETPKKERKIRANRSVYHNLQMQKKIRYLRELTDFRKLWSGAFSISK